MPTDDTPSDVASGPSTQHHPGSLACMLTPCTLPPQAWEAADGKPPSMTLHEYYKIMLRDYGFGRAEVNEVVDAADPGDDFRAVLDRLHARHGL